MAGVGVGVGAGAEAEAVGGWCTRSGHYHKLHSFYSTDERPQDGWATTTEQHLLDYTIIYYYTTSRLEMAWPLPLHNCYYTNI